MVFFTREVVEVQRAQRLLNLDILKQCWLFFCNFKYLNASFLYIIIPLNMFKLELINVFHQLLSELE